MDRSKTITEGAKDLAQTIMGMFWIADLKEDERELLGEKFIEAIQDEFSALDAHVSHYALNEVWEGQIKPVLNDLAFSEAEALTMNGKQTSTVGRYKIAPGKNSQYQWKKNDGSYYDPNMNHFNDAIAKHKIEFQTMIQANDELVQKQKDIALAEQSLKDLQERLKKTPAPDSLSNTPPTYTVDIETGEEYIMLPPQKSMTHFPKLTKLK